MKNISLGVAFRLKFTVNKLLEFLIKMYDVVFEYQVEIIDLENLEGILSISLGITHIRTSKLLMSNSFVNIKSYLLMFLFFNFTHCPKEKKSHIS